jgi:hypothetical protein
VLLAIGFLTAAAEIYAGERERHRAWNQAELAIKGAEGMHSGSGRYAFELVHQKRGSIAKNIALGRA